MDWWKCEYNSECIEKKLESTYNLVVSAKTIDNYIESFSYSFKTISLLPSRRNNDKALIDRADFAQRFLQILSRFDEANIIFVDEVGFNISTFVANSDLMLGIYTVPCICAKYYKQRFYYRIEIFCYAWFVYLLFDRSLDDYLISISCYAGFFKFQ